MGSHSECTASLDGFTTNARLLHSPKLRLHYECTVSLGIIIKGYGLNGAYSQHFATFATSAWLSTQQNSIPKLRTRHVVGNDPHLHIPSPLTFPCVVPLNGVLSMAFHMAHSSVNRSLSAQSIGPHAVGCRARTGVRTRIS